MRDEVELLRKVAAVLDAGEMSYFVCGSIAAMYYGEARLTRDIDIAIHLRYGDIPTLRDAITEPEFYLDPQSMLRALREVGQFNAIHNPTGMKVDFMCVERTPMTEVAFARARRVEVLPGVMAWTASPEDIILKKLEYYKEGKSDKHTRDIAGMIRVSGPQLDYAYLELWADRLGVRSEWDVVRAKADEP